MLFYLVTFLLVIPSPVLMFISSEAWAILVGLTSDRPWAAVAFALAAGQTVGFSLLYFFGERVLARTPKLQSKFDSFDKQALAEKAPWVLSTSGLIGFPPHNLLCAAAPMVGVRYHWVLITTFVGRFTRYCLFAATPHLFSEYFGTDWMPMWLKTLI